MNEALKKKVPLSRIQKLIGKLMLQSKQEGAFFYLQSKADVTELVALRKPYCKRVKARVTTNDFFFFAIARAIKKFPLMAGRLDETGKYIDITEHIGIGFAVSAAQGLVVPVIQDVAGKSLIQIASESDELLKKARANKLMPDDFYGANIAVTSLGMYGVTSFFAIAPPGTVGIISMGTIDEHVVPINGDMMVRKIMTLALAADRKIVNEFYASKFLKYIIKQIEYPAALTE
jgi:pyruvate dehydrogenase E2 component (dihydrolipoamide acetyltransferase)